MKCQATLYFQLTQKTVAHENKSKIYELCIYMKS